MAAPIDLAIATFRLNASQCILAITSYNCQRGTLDPGQIANFKRELLHCLIACRVAWDSLGSKPKIPPIMASMFCELDTAQTSIDKRAKAKKQIDHVIDKFRLDRVANSDSRIKQSTFKVCELEAFELEDVLNSWCGDLSATNQSATPPIDQTDPTNATSLPLISVNEDTPAVKDPKRGHSTTIKGDTNRCDAGEDALANPSPDLQQTSARPRDTTSRAKKIVRFRIGPEVHTKKQDEEHNPYTGLIVHDIETESPHICKQCKDASRHCFVNPYRSSRCVACSHDKSKQCSIAPQWNGHVMATRSGGGYVLQRWINHYGDNDSRTAGAGIIGHDEHNQAQAWYHNQSEKHESTVEPEATPELKGKKVLEGKRKHGNDADTHITKTKRPRLALMNASQTVDGSASSRDVETLDDSGRDSDDNSTNEVVSNRKLARGDIRLMKEELLDLRGQVNAFIRSFTK